MLLAPDIHSRSMHIHWLQHADHEDLGCIAPWLAGRGHSTSCTRLHLGEALPNLAGFDWLIVLGGPMNIYEHQAHPWLIAEKVFIAEALLARKKVLGICLGAQLLADVLGGSTTRNAQCEIGWHPVRLTPAGESDRAFKGFESVFVPFHWHGDRFELPPGSQSLMTSEACAHQAFSAGAGVVGIQFHLEVTAANLRDWFALEQPTPATYVQTSEEVLHDLPRFARSNALMHQLLANIESA